MTPEYAYQILVIILSITLAIFLILAIITSTLAIKFLKKANRIADSAEVVVGNVEEFSTSLKNASGPIAFIRTVMSAARGVSGK